MKTTVNRAAFVAALKLAVQAADARATMPALKCALLRVDGKRLLVAATDLNVSLATEVPCSESGDGVALVGAAPLLKVCDRMAGDQIALAAADANMVITSGRAKATEPTLPVRDYPKLCDPKMSTHEIDAAALRTVLEACLPAACTDESRFHLNGVLLHFMGDRVRAAATDGHRLHLRTAACAATIKATHGVIVPCRAIGLLLHLLEDAATVRVGKEGSHLFVVTEGATLAVKLIDAQFPPYEQVVPKSVRAATLDAAAIVEALRRVSLAATETRGVGLDSDGSELRISAADGDRSASDVVDIEAGPAKIAHGASSKYVIEAVQCLGADQVDVHAKGELDPLVFAAAGADPTVDGGNLAVVMPMRR